MSCKFNLVLKTALMRPCLDQLHVPVSDVCVWLWTGLNGRRNLMVYRFFEQNGIKKTRRNKIFRLWKNSGSVGRRWSKLFCALSRPQTQQWVRPVPEGRGLLLHKDLLWDGGGRLRSTSCPAGSGPALLIHSSQLGPLWFSSKLRPPDAPDSPAKVQLQLWTWTEQAQSAQPVGPQQLLADPLWASISGGYFSPITHFMRIKHKKSTSLKQKHIFTYF